MEEQAPWIQVTEEPLTAAPGYPGVSDIMKGSLSTPPTGVVMKHHSCLEIVPLPRTFSSKLMSSESFLAEVFIGFSCTKDTNNNTHLESTRCTAAVTTRRTCPTTTLDGLIGFSDLSATFQSGELDPFFECVFICPLFISKSTERVVNVNMDKRMHAQIWKKRKSILFHLLRCHLSLAVHF